MPSLVNTSSKGGGVLGVPVADQETELPGPLPQVHHQVAGLLPNPDASGVGGGAQDVHPPGGDLHQKQHIDAGQPDRVDVEEIAGEDALGLGVQELGPRRPGPPRRRIHTGLGQDGPHGAGRHRVTQANQLTLDTTLTPPRVLLRQAQHQRPDLCLDRRAPRPAPGVGPVRAIRLRCQRSTVAG